MSTTIDEIDGAAEVPIWAVFGDLMAGLLGAFVLILVCALGIQFDLANRLEAEVRQRQAEAQRREALEKALAGPLAAGRVTLDNGRIGISGSVLFAFNSAELQPEGRQLLKSLATPLATYLQSRDEILMVSGFTDDRQVRNPVKPAPPKPNAKGSPAPKASFADNWELSAQRALTVTRSLIEEGVPSSTVFAAAFGAEQPVASNDNAEGRALNRRVEMAPTPRPTRATPVAKHE
ncbi:OmpA family protein [Ideonella sp. YS5]|uniref:OmpA family protein n=1 Tax=Ideonella sp. YS5 TaxID=3453714 RepID=UPI003EEEC084